MAAADVAPAGDRQDWALGNPWVWASLGLLLCLAALTWSLTMGEERSGVSALLLFFGLVTAGGAVALRLTSSAPAALDELAPPTRSLVLFLLTALFALLALAATAVLVLSFFDPPWLPWRTGQAVIVWLVVAPLSVAAVRRSIRRGRDGQATVTPQEEGAALLIVGAVMSFAGCWALYFGPNSLSWYTVRLFLAVLTCVALAAAPLLVVSLRARRVALSALVLLHFGGIATATLAAPPSPWPVGQLWTRIYRPYLEFMYLNNAYHFYAPEPGPASHLWFRLIYADGDGREHGEWFKVPKLNEKTGQPEHPVALEYQRHLALTENVVSTDPAPPTTVTDGQGNYEVAPYFKRRTDHAPGPIRIGVPAPSLVVPFHPFLNPTQQYAPPNAAAKRLLASYARHVAATKAAERPEWKFRAVKIYRARHEIPPVDAFTRGWSANDPELFRPFYMGMFNADGELLDPDDPFLYWLLPIMRENASDIRSPIKDYARKHAGDANWIRATPESGWGPG